MDMDIKAADLRAVRAALGSERAGPLRVPRTAELAGVSKYTWNKWEADGPKGSAWHVVRLLCIDQGLVKAEDDFRAWLDGLPAPKSEDAA